MNKRAWTYVLLPLLLAAAGCTHTQLRWNTVQQSRTLTEIYEQQVLDNLAMFVTDPNSLPGFAYPNAGGSNVQDSASAGSMTNWVRNGGFSTQGLNLSGSRGMSESWTMTPIYDVRRLELMRCAYQQALVATGVYSNLSGCPNCEKLQRKFYTGNEDGSDDVATFTNKTGRTTPACLAPVCWFGHGERKCLPKDCKCLKVGCYCGTYVWVLPGGQDELTKLTLTILDYAFSTQASATAPRTKEVTWYLDKHGNPVNEDHDTAQVIKATVPYSEKVRLGSDPNDPNAGIPADMTVVPTMETEAEKSARMNRLEQARQRLLERRKSVDDIFDRVPSPEYVTPPILPSPSNSMLQFDQSLRFLTPLQFGPAP